jgi:hypothetical protein
MVFYVEHNPCGSHRLPVAGKKYGAGRIIVRVYSFQGIECIAKDCGLKLKRKL